MLRENLSYSKSVESSDFAVLKMYFSQHMNRGKYFAHSDLM
jgi:hypothetical protein